MAFNLTVPARDLFGHMEWADALVCRAVLASPDASADAKICDVLQHYGITQRAFLALWRQVDLDFRSFMTEPRDPAATAASMQRYYEKLNRWLEESGEAQQQQQTLMVPWAAMLEQRLGRQPERVSIGESMVQVAMHSAHHRAQVLARLRAVGVEPPLVDFIAWAWLGRPAADWPAFAAG